MVVVTKDFMLWDMKEILNILTGALYNKEHFLLASCQTRFVKRCLRYAKPSKQFFSLLKWNSNMIIHSKCLCQLFKILLVFHETNNNIFFDELIEQIIQYLKDQISSNIHSNNIMFEHNPFNRNSMRFTLSRTYMKLIRILSETQIGINYFIKHNFRSFRLTIITNPTNLIISPKDYLFRLIAMNVDM
eukprot:103380_1